MDILISFIFFVGVIIGISYLSIILTDYFYKNQNENRLDAY